MEKKKILVVEDSQDDIDTFLGIVHRDFEVIDITKFDPFEVLKIVKKDDIQAVILDLYENDGSGNERPQGLEVLKAIRKQLTPEQLPIIIHSTSSRAHLMDATRCIQEGAQDWIWKDANLMSGAEKKTRINKAIENAKHDITKKKQFDDTLEQKNKYFIFYGMINCIASIVLMLYGIFQKNIFIGGVLPVLLILALAISWNLIKKLNLRQNLNL